MPQMAPIYWLFMFFVFLFSLILFFMSTYFLVPFTKAKSQDVLPHQLINKAWKL